MAYHRQQGVDTAIVRIFNTYGPRMRPHDGRAIPTFVRQALERKPITVFGDGSQTRSFCYVDDLIRGLVALQESGEHLPVNIGNPNEFTLLELAEKVVEIWGGSQRDRLRGAAGRRSEDPPAGHHPRPADPRLGAGDLARRRPAPAARGAAGSAGCVTARRLLAVALVAAALFAVPVGVGVALPPARASSTTPRSTTANPDQVFPMLKTLQHAGGSRQPGLGWPERRRASAGRSTRRTRTIRRTTGRSTTGRSTTRRSTGSRSCSRSSARRRGRTPPPASTSRRGARSTCERFAVAAARRYSGTFKAPDGRILPPVRHWLAWNEPNNPAFLRPQYRTVGGKLGDPERDRLREDLQRRREGRPEDDRRRVKVACGVTGPRGNNNPNSVRPSVSPLAVPARR